MLTTTTATTTIATTTAIPHDGVDDDDGHYSTAPSSPAAFLSPPSPPPPPPTNFFFYSAPTSPMHYVLSAARSSFSPPSSAAAAAADDFEFSSRVGSPSAVTSADELFLNGQIRPMKLSAHLSRPHHHDDHHDDDNDDDHHHHRGDMRLRNRSQRRRARSMSPLRSTTPFDWITTPETTMTSDEVENKSENENDVVMTSAESASSSRCSSAGRSSKRWLFLKDFLRSKSEGRSNNKFWQNINIAFAPTSGAKAMEKDKEKEKKTVTKKAGVRRSAHEVHYATNRAKAEERKKKTYLPYRQGVLGCLGFNARSYGALHGFASALNPVSSR